MILPLPFSSKELPNGKRLKRKPVGIQFTIPANGSITVTHECQFAHAKLNMVEVLWSPEYVRAQMNVRDTASGTYSTIPNALLDTFGVNVNIASGYWKGRSEYDADIYLGMVIEFVIVNDSAVSKTVGINMVFHEVTG